MKRVAAFFLSLMALLTFLSCEKETLLSVDQTSINVSDAGGSSTVSLTANKPWTASSNQSWCKVSPSSGEEATSSRISISCDPNTTYDARNATVTFTCAELTKQVSITQTMNNGLMVTQTSYELTKAAQQLNIEVKANVKFSVEVDSGCKDWVKYNTTKALTTSTVVLDIAENKSYDGREGKVTIKQDGGSLSSTVTIKQSQLDGLFLTTSEYNLSNEKHTLTVEVSTNVEFDVKPEADWVKYVQTKGLSTKQIVLEVAENDTYDLRETKVNVKQKNGDLSGTITIKQDEKYGILVSQAEYNLTNGAQTIDIEIKYNVDFEVSIPDGCKDWIKQVSTKGLNTKNYTFSIAKNETYDNREGSITFKQKKGSLSGTVAIKQAQTDYLEVAKNEYTVDIEGETITIEVTSNVDYSVSIKDDAQSWLSKVGTKGLSKDNVQIAVAAGDDNTDRKGEIIISHGDLKRTIKVHQYSYAANTIIQFADEKVKAKLVEAFDTNGDGELSIREARAAKSIEGVFGAIKTYTSFDEFKYFTGVTTIPESMFEDWRLTSITLPESITTIGNKAFKNCTALGIVHSLGTISVLPERIFDGCTKLSKVEIPETISTIKAYAFCDCKSITEIKIPEKVTSLGVGVFYGCEKIKEIIIPNEVNSIGAGAFSGCKSISSISIPEGITSLSRGTFYGCENLSEIILPKGLTIINSDTSSREGGMGQCFGECQKLVSIELPEGLETIGTGAFWGCRNLSSIIIPKTVTNLSECVFWGCSNLTTVVLPKGIQSIGPSTFRECNKLKTIEIPESVVLIGNYAFYECTSLDNVIIPESVTTIGQGAFFSCSTLSTIIIPESVYSIGSSGTEVAGAFQNCTSLKKIDLPESLTSLGSGTFKGCSKLEKVIIPESVSTLGWEMFSDCVNLQEVILPDQMTYIGSGFFYNCVNLQTINLPSTITQISGASYNGNNYKTAGGAFEGCSSLSSIDLPEGLTYLGYEAFANCTSLTSITIPGSLTQISDAYWAYRYYEYWGGCFYNCTGLTTVIFKEGVQRIGINAFRGCKNLSSIIIPNSVTSIGYSAFAECQNIKKVIVNDVASWCEIQFDNEVSNPLMQGASMYLGEKKITDLIIPDQTRSIKEYAFAGCSGFNTVTIHKDVTSIGFMAFYQCNNLNRIELHPSTPPTLVTSEYNYSGAFINTNNCPIYVPSSSVEAYKSTEGWKEYADRIKALP